MCSFVLVYNGTTCTPSIDANTQGQKRVGEEVLVLILHCIMRQAFTSVKLYS